VRLGTSTMFLPFLVAFRATGGPHSAPLHLVLFPAPRPIEGRAQPRISLSLYLFLSVCLLLCCFSSLPPEAEEKRQSTSLSSSDSPNSLPCSAMLCSARLPPSFR
jgi:hypothetical protein